MKKECQTITCRCLCKLVGPSVRWRRAAKQRPPLPSFHFVPAVPFVRQRLGPMALRPKGSRITQEQREHRRLDLPGQSLHLSTIIVTTPSQSKRQYYVFKFVVRQSYLVCTLKPDRACSKCRQEQEHVSRCSVSARRRNDYGTRTGMNARRS